MRRLLVVIEYPLRWVAIFLFFSGIVIGDLSEFFRKRRKRE